jgi:glycosyltransferase involved in cell wall biosynthesis
MPCYNVAHTVDEAMASLLAQSLDDLEVVAVDDGSSDATPGLLLKWAESDGRVRPVLAPHRGLIAALNAGLAVCQADLIARMDADDRAHPARLERQLAFLNAHPEVDVVGCLVEGFPSGQVREGFRIYLEWLNSLVSADEIARQMYVESPLAHPSVVMRREPVERLGAYQDRGWPEDYDLWLRLHLNGARMAKVPQVLLSWREHPGRLTRTDRRYSVENFLRAKAHYLLAGPLHDRGSVLIWGAGQMGRRLSKHLVRGKAPLAGFIDIDPAKIGKVRRGLPIHAPEALPAVWDQLDRPVLLAAVGARGARRLIREQLVRMGLREGEDWWAAA